MPTISDLYKEALLAMSSYALDEPPYDDPQMVNALTESLTGTGAVNFSEKFDFVTGIETSDDINGNTSGFDASVLRDVNGKIYLAIRGSEVGQDFATDVALALNGFGGAQVIDMVNWWLRITACKEGPKVMQLALERVEDPTSILGFKTIVVQGIPVSGTGQVTAEELAKGIEVVGHSLGGYLATAFTRLLGRQAYVEHTTTFNSAGFLPASEEAFRAISDMLPYGFGLEDYPTELQQTNVFAANGMNFTTNEWWFRQNGDRVALFNEEGTGVPNHRIYKLVDTLALGAVLDTLSPGLSISTLNRIVSLGSAQTNASIEGALDALRVLLNGPATQPTLIGDDPDSPPSRQDFYAKLDALQNSELINSLAGRLSIAVSAPSVLASQASQDFSAFLSLLTLSPLRLEGKDPAASAALTSALRASWESAYVAWQADALLPPAARTYGDNWLADRERLMRVLQQRNIADVDDGIVVDPTADGIYQFSFSVGAGPRQTLWLTQQPINGEGGLPLSAEKEHFISFGSENADSILGTNNVIGDRLYGEGGNDSMSGAGGNDFMEGGGGDDVLDGGKGSDTLHGGLGNDTYRFVTGDGNDVIVDTDGIGQIVFDGLALTGGSAVAAGNCWTAADATGREIRYVVSQGQSGSSVLSISIGTDSIKIENFENGKFGINLITSGLPLPGTSRTIVGDRTAIDFDPGPGLRFQYDDLGNIVTSTTILEGREDNLKDGAGDDLISSGGGSDYIDAFRGGNDIIEAGSGSDIARAGAGNDFVYANDSMVLGLAIANGELGGSSSVKGDWLNGQAGNDVVVGGADKDALFGGAGDDIIVGGAGDDIIDGDDDYSALAFDWEAVALTWEEGFNGTLEVALGNEGHTGNDVLYGGGGNDAILGMRGKDVLYGGTGSDMLTGGSDSDALFGGDGNDRMTGDAGGLTEGQNRHATVFADDFLDGGAGDDWMQGEGGSDSLYGGDGNDIIFGDAGDYIDAAHEGNDYLDGGAGNDTMLGQGGDDTLIGGSGDDILIGDLATAPALSQGSDALYGGIGNDQLWGYGGNDQLFGEAGLDILFGGDGEDLLDGGQDHDEAHGGAGDDILRGGAGDDVLAGDAGDDHLDGEDGYDSIYGGEGNDVLVGGGGADYLNGEQGNDTYLLNIGDGHRDSSGIETISDVSGNNTLRFGEGIALEDLKAEVDATGSLHIRYSDDDGVIVKSGSVTQFILANGSAFSVDELLTNASQTPVFTTAVSDNGYVHGGAASDGIVVTGNNVTVNAARGDDYIHMLGKNGTLMIGEADGIDTVLGSGLSRLRFSVNIPAQTLRLRQDQYWDGEAGVLKSRYRLNYGYNGGLVLIDDSAEVVNMVYEMADGTTLTHSAVLEQSGLALRWRGSAAAEHVTGTRLDDSMFGGDGNDVLEGGSGNDWIDGQNGSNSLFGGDGDDTLRGGDGSAYADLLDGAAGDDELYGLAGNDALSGGAGDDLLDGGNGSDSLNGGDGNDRILAGNGDDALFGGLGNDDLSGGAGNDTISAGAGSDIARGGLGDDTYLIDSSSGQLIVTDDYGKSTIKIGPGIALENITGSYLNGDDGHLYLELKIGAERTIYIQQSFDHGLQPIEFIDADGQVISEAIFHRSSESFSYMAPRGEAVRVSGGNGDDILIGGEFGDVLTGGAGSDQLAGGEGADTIYGGDGDDLLVGNQGNDSLFGGAGIDTYRMGRGMGADTIVDAADETSVLLLESGLSLDDLAAVRVGDDLQLVIRNTQSGAVIKDYFDGPHTWQISTSAGIQVALEDVIEELAPPPRPTSLAQRWDQFRTGLRAATVEALYAAGYKRNDDGSFTAVRLLDSDTRREEQIYDASLGTSLLIGDDADLYDGSDGVESLGSTSEYWTEQHVVPHLLSPVAASPNPGPIYVPVLAGTQGVGYPLGSLAVPRYGDVYDTNPLTGEVYREIIGYWIYEPTPQHPQPVYQDEIETKSFSQSQTQLRLNVREIIAGLSNNRIEFSGPAMVDAGGGDDIIVDNTPKDTTSGEIFADMDEPVASGSFLYGNDGNDIIMAGARDDVIVGGRGDDILYGGGGADTYAMEAGGGSDLIVDFDIGRAEDNILELPDGVSLGSLRVTYVEANQRIPGAALVDPEGYGDFDVTSAYWAMDVTWGDGNDKVRIVIPRTAQRAGDGIDLFRFADGTSATYTQVKAIATNVPTIEADSLANEIHADGIIFGGAGNDVIVLTGSGRAFGDGGADVLIGSDGDDTLGGGSLSAHAYSAISSDVSNIWDEGGIYRGGAGNDNLYATAGDDIYEYALGDGYDVVTDQRHNWRYLYYGSEYMAGVGWADDLDALQEAHKAQLQAGQDVLRLGAGILASDVQLNVNGLSLDISVIGQVVDDGYSYEGEVGRIVFENWSAQLPSVNGVTAQVENQLDCLEFLDGTVWHVNRDGSYTVDGSGLHFGTAGDDTLQKTIGNHLLSGEDGDDALIGGSGDDLLVGGAGNDTIDAGSGHDVIAFNRGDGMDRLAGNGEIRKTLSLGGGICYEDLCLSRIGDDLFLSTGETDGITLEDWYSDNGNKSVATLQIILGNDYDPNGDALHSQKVQQFDFNEMVSRFDVMQIETPDLALWSLNDSLLDFHLAASDTSAIGGDLAYSYAISGQIDASAVTVGMLSSGDFGRKDQGLST